jgi:Ca2+-dependent lipid-binding protein
VTFACITGLGRFLIGPSYIGLLAIASIVSSAVYYWSRSLVDEARNVDWESEKRRGETAAANLIPESVEWLNRLLGIGWNLINPEMFSALADTLEDVMQASVPGIVQNVRVADISQGSNPMRILSLRALPEADVGDLKRSAMVARAGKDEEEKMAEEEGGEVYNLECAFAYHAAPTKGRGVSARSRNMHLQVEFYVGVKGLVGVPIRESP